MLKEWIRCPVCGGKIRVKVRRYTELRNFPLYCPKCKQETVINMKQFVIIEPDAKTQSQ